MKDTLADCMLKTSIERYVKDKILPPHLYDVVPESERDPQPGD